MEGYVLFIGLSGCSGIRNRLNLVGIRRLEGGMEQGGGSLGLMWRLETYASSCGSAWAVLSSGEDYRPMGNTVTA